MARVTTKSAPANVPNDLEAYWLPFTANRAFKAAPRLIARSKDMHYFTPEGRALIHDRVASDERIEVADEDARRLAANAVCLGNTLVLSGCSDGLRARLAEHGYRVRATPLASFLRSGGSAFCLTLRLDRRSASSRS